MLLIFSSLGIVALVIGMGTSGMVSVYAITSVGLFCVRFGLVSLLWQLAD
jgi:FHS family L-fucose permease-like MFS transporter